MNTGFGVGATFFGVVFGISGQTRAMVLCLLAGIASILSGIWPTLRKLWRPARQNPEPLSLREKRLLVIAVAFPSRKGRSSGGRVWYPVHSGLESKYYFDKVRVLARGRALGTSAKIEARFRAEGVDQTYDRRGKPARRRAVQRLEIPQAARNLAKSSGVAAYSHAGESLSKQKGILAAE